MIAKPNLDIETMSTCNRKCSTCLRNSHPDRDAASPWFKRNFLEEKYIYTIIDEAERLGFFNEICLNFYNEPLLDWRLPHIVKNIKRYYTKYPLYLHSNGDLMQLELAEQLDGLLDKIIFTLYINKDERSQRASELKYFFKKTEVVVIEDAKHVPTHFSPDYPIVDMAKSHQNNPCLEPAMRVVLGHDRKYRACCDDLLGIYNLGTFPEKSLEEHWEEKQKLISILSRVGGRRNYLYCITCPRP